MKYILLFFIFFSLQNIWASNPKITKEELEEKFHPENKDAVASILEKNGTVFYEYTPGVGFVMVRKIYQKIKIYKKGGLHYGIQKVKLWKSGKRTDAISKLKATTYSLLNGKIEKSEMKKSGVFKDETAPTYNTVKFTLPKVLEGSVIEFSYKITSPFFTYFPTFYFQKEIPIKNQNIVIEIPEYFKYNLQTRGDKNLNIKRSSKNGRIIFRNRHNTANEIRTQEEQGIDFTTNTYTINTRNIEAYQKEPYVSNIYSYIPSIEFDLASIQYPYSNIHNYSNTWKDVLKKYKKHWAFKEQIKLTGYYKNDLKELVDNVSDYKSRINKIFNFVKFKMAWNKRNTNMAYRGVKNAYKNSTGSSGQINLILLSMLKEAKIKARPVFVSTTDIPLSIFPSYNAFNYVIVEVAMPDNSKIYLDATDKKAIPNILPKRVIKGQGKLLTDSGIVAPIDLRPKKSTVNTMLSFKVDEEGLVEGKVKQMYKGYEAYAYRYSSKPDIEKVQETLKEKNNIPEIKNYSRTGFKKLYENINVNYEFSGDELITAVDNEFYINPLLFFRTENNPFKIDERKYPIDYGYAFIENYIVNIVIPEGFSVTSLPKNTSVKLPEDLGTFSYRAMASGNTIQLRIKKEITKPFIGIKSYPLIKEFMNQLVKKENEQIVLNKI